MMAPAQAAEHKLGVSEGRLAPCPTSPNCVSSQADQEGKLIEPFRYDGDRQAAKTKLLSVITGFPRTRVETDDGRYLHVVFTTRLLRFKDDVEFYFAEDEPVIHVRSASRVGYSDLGTNRRRVEALRKAFAAQ
jgi:uncharacterized protein (DUF1499 family)